MSGKINLDVLTVMAQLGISIEKLQESGVLDHHESFLHTLDANILVAGTLDERIYLSIEQPDYKKKTHYELITS